MNPFQTTKSNLLMCCIIIGTFSISTGCKLGFPSGKTSLPQPKNFKFWETEDKLSASENKETPPPPARHFSPSPLDPEQEDIVMDLKSPPAGERQQLGSINELRQEVTKVSENTANPIRKPYQMNGLSNKKPSSPNNSPDSFAGRDLPNVQPNGFTGQFKSNKNDFVSMPNSTQNSVSPNSGFKAPNPAAPSKNTDLLSFGGSLTDNSAFQFNGSNNKKPQPETNSSLTEAAKIKSELLRAQEQLKALQNNKAIPNPNKSTLPPTTLTNKEFKAPSQPFVKPPSTTLTPEPKYPSTNFDSFAQKPFPQKPLGATTPPADINNSLGSAEAPSPPPAFKLPQAQQIPPIDNTDSKSAVQNISNEVDLPPSILFGKSTYAPGSTKKLIPQ